MEIVLAEKRHLPEICRIENELFSLPWSEDSFKAELDCKSTVFAVAEDGEKVCGFAIERHCFDEGEIFNIAVSQDKQGQKIGEKLLSFVLEAAEKRGVNTVFLEVRKSNYPAISLYKKSGFTEMGIRKNYYDSPKEDAVLMIRERKGR